MTVHVHLVRREQWRCPVCGRRCGVYDHASAESFWRGMDFGPVPVRIGAVLPRVNCPAHGVLTARVPWAGAESRFTTDFAFSAAWMFKGGLSRKRISEWLKVDFKTVGRLVRRVWNLLEPDPKVRYSGLVNIGIDETSSRKGHSYITVVVNHDTNTVVWAHDGYGKEVVEMFFEELAEGQRSSIRLVSGDGARWITDAVAKYCPNATRYLDPFHVVEWANDALGSMRIDAWRRAREKLAEIVRKYKEEGIADDREAKEEIRRERKKADEIKRSKYALGKNPENLTKSQQERLELIQAVCADITYISTGEGFLFLALVMDMVAKDIVGWDISESLEADGAVRALKMAGRKLPRGARVVAHSDKGCQYGSRKYLEVLAALGCLSSMTEELHCYENAMAERLNGILKGEYCLDCCFRTKAEAIAAVKRVIEIYNTHRLHEKLGYKTPAAYREEMAKAA